MAEPRTRRPPPDFRPAEVARVVERTPRLVRVTLAGAALRGLPAPTPAASVRLLLPRDGGDELVLPTWNGNEWLFDDGTRPWIRTLTPLRFAAADPELDVEIVLHGPGPLATWAARAVPGAVVGLAGTGRGYEVDPSAPLLLLAGDESAVPAITTILDALPPEAVTAVLVEVADPSARLVLPREVTWVDLPPGAPPGAALVEAVTELALPEGARVWAAGEAAAMQRIRRHLFDERGVARDRTVIRGYWKVGRAESG